VAERVSEEEEASAQSDPGEDGDAVNGDAVNGDAVNGDAVNGSPGPSESPQKERSAGSGWRPYLIALLVAMVAYPLLFRPLFKACMSHVPEPPPVYGQLPDFTLVSQDGDPFGSDDLRGDVWVANFIFTSCPSVCPSLTRAMKSLQDRYEQNDIPVRLVSITVDPEVDTPQRLREYALEYGADLDRWTFLTGDESAIRALIVEGFQLGVGEPTELPGGGTALPPAGEVSLYEISHSQRFVLVDGGGGIRGYYETSEDGLDEIYHRSQHVLREQREAAE
jgi:protein SCO1/2